MAFWDRFKAPKRPSSAPEAGSPNYDVHRATEALTAIGQAVVDDPVYRATPWAGVALVAELDGRTSLYGYLYRPNGTWVAELPDGFGCLDLMEELRKAMREPGKDSWKTALFQWRRAPEIQFHATFEYDDGDRWRMNPALLEERVEELRPR